MQGDMRLARTLSAAALVAALAFTTVSCASPVAGEPSGGPASPATAAPSIAASPSAAASLPASSPVGSPGSPQPSIDVTPQSTADPAAAALASRTWATTALNEVSSGQAFTIAGLAGRTIFVEAMAIWCTKCREQQFRFRDALARLDPATVAYVVLTVDPSETANELARYKRDRAFVGMYAVAGRNVSAALEQEFGSNVLNPPTVPLILVTAGGEIRFETGGESVDEIVRLAGG
jgi:hypothetical protein